GAIFELAPDSGDYTATIIGRTKGSFAGLVMDNAGNLYGTDAYADTVYELVKTNSGYRETTLYVFKDGNDGTGPSYVSMVFDQAGNLYGTTTSGGPRGQGTVYKLSANPDGSWNEKVLYSFKGGSDGAVPMAGVTLDSTGNLYGTTINGGSTRCQN